MHSKWFLVLLIPFSLLMGACSGGSFETSNLPIIGRTDAPTPSVTSTPLPTSTHTPSPTPLPTSTITPTPTPTEPEPTPTPESIVVENLDNIPIETVGCIDERLCSGIEVIDGKTAMREVYDTFANGPKFREYWKSLGWNIPRGENAADVFVDYLKNSIGGPENKPYWVPVEDENNPFIYLQGRSGSPVGIFAENKKVNEYGGFYLDKVGAVFIGLNDWQNKPEIKGWYESFEFVKITGPGKRDFIYANGSGRPATSWLFYGLVPFEGRFIFIAGSQLTVDFDDIFARRNQLGVGDNPTDFEKTQAFWDSYFGISKEWPTDPDEDLYDYQNRDLAISPSKYTRSNPVYRNVMGVDARLFGPTK